MKKITGIGSLCVILSVSAAAQTAVSRIYIKGGKDAWTNYLQEVYLNPSFSKGIVEYKNGKQYKSILNYNKVLGAIQFIDEKGDTLALNNDEKTVKTVEIGDELFYMDPVCMQRITGNEKVVLAKNERAKQADKQKVGAMGIPNSAGTIDSYDRTYSRNNHYIDINEELLIRKTTNFYIAGSELKFIPASQKNILGMFPKSEGDIKKFIKEKSIDLNVESDLVTLAEYLQSL